MLLEGNDFYIELSLKVKILEAEVSELKLKEKKINNLLKNFYEMDEWEVNDLLKRFRKMEGQICALNSKNDIEY